MKDGSSSNSLPKRASDLLPAAVSELNNLLQIITGTVKLLEKMWEGDSRATKCFEMLHLNTDQATQILS